MSSEDTVASLREELVRSRERHEKERTLWTQEKKSLLLALSYSDTRSQVMRTELTNQKELKTCQKLLIRMRDFCLKTRDEYAELAKRHGEDTRVQTLKWPLARTAPHQTPSYCMQGKTAPLSGKSF